MIRGLGAGAGYAVTRAQVVDARPHLDDDPRCGVPGHRAPCRGAAHELTGCVESLARGDIDDPSEGAGGHGGWGTFALGSPYAQNGHNLFGGSTGVPFNPVIPDPAADTTHLIGYSSRHSGGVNFVFLDGSVRFLSDATSQMAREGIGTRANGEVFSLD